MGCEICPYAKPEIIRYNFNKMSTMRFLIVIVMSAFSMKVFCQTDSTKIAFVSYWSIGDSYDFIVSKSKQQWKDGVLTKDDKQEYLANFTVMDSTENSYTIKWIYEFDLGGTYQFPAKFLDKLSKYKISEIDYKTSEVGNIIEILNWEEIGENMNNLFDDMVELLGEEDEADQELYKKALQPFKEIYSSKEGIEQVVLKDLQYFHFPLGVELDITGPIFYDDELPNIIGGDPFKANAKLYFESIDLEESFCVLKQEISLDPADIRAFLEQLFIKMIPVDKGMEEYLKTASFEIKDSNTYEYYYYPGIPHEIEAVREAFLDINNVKLRTVETTMIELLYNE
jgi:hypothetical protein